MDYGIGGGEDARGLIECRNVPQLISILVTAKAATLHELDTVYGLEDAYKLLEIVAVDSHNLRVMEKRNGQNGN